ncbi:MAG TPA: hypothetical protein VJP79_00945 [Nitrososphaera sp.]|nr:hypothetical protein [Nitrososphaera sp.]
MRFQLPISPIIFIILLSTATATAVGVVPSDASAFCDDFTTPGEISLVDIGVTVRLGIDYLPENQTQNFIITFINNQTQSIQRHVDYNFVIKNITEGALTDEFFNAAESTGQSVLHTAEGVVTIPAKLNIDDYGMAIVTVSGVNFIPLETPQDAMFPCVVAPEFPLGLIGIIVAATFVIATFVASTHFKRSSQSAGQIGF